MLLTFCYSHFNWDSWKLCITLELCIIDILKATVIFFSSSENKRTINIIIFIQFFPPLEKKIKWICLILCTFLCLPSIKLEGRWYSINKYLLIVLISLKFLHCLSIFMTKVRLIGYSRWNIIKYSSRTLKQADFATNLSFSI